LFKDVRIYSTYPRTCAAVPTKDTQYYIVLLHVLTVCRTQRKTIECSFYADDAIAGTQR